MYFYELRQAGADTWKPSRRRGTLKAIARLGGRPLLETALDVSADTLDIDGLHRPEFLRPNS